MKILQVSTYFPEKCGLASYTEDLARYCQRVDNTFGQGVIAINGHREPSEYGEPVDFLIDKHERRDYIEAADYANEDEDVVAVSLQHEFGIFGGEDGEYVLDFVSRLRKPLVTTFHTSKARETPNRKRILEELIALTNKVVLISYASKEIFEKNYGADPKKVEVIHHGFHNFSEPEEHCKRILSLEKKAIMSTVGLVRRARGIEFAIEALPYVVEKHPDCLYVVAGSSHPNEVKAQGGDKYRGELMERVDKLKLQNHVRFVNRYLSLEHLLRYIQASDICITPYRDMEQTSSGVLSYSIGLMKPVVSSPFRYAREILGNGRGLIAEAENPRSFAEQINLLIENPDLVKSIRERLKGYREHMKWDNVAKRYVEFYQHSVNS